MDFKKFASDSDDIAVIGMAGKFPMAGNLGEFRENLQRGKDCIGNIPGARREDWLPVYGETTDRLPQSGYLETIAQFDPQFFGIASGEALYIDPAQRLLLETVYQAFEYAGYGGIGMNNRLSHTRTGVFVSYGDSRYKEFINDADYSMAAEVGNLPAVTAGRISHFFNLSGPSLLIDTACSSSLTALHYACESLKRNECSMAVVGAVNLCAYFDGKTMGGNAGDGNISEEGEDEDKPGLPRRCRVFDRSAGGVINGEGVGALLLKPLKQALADHDIVCAVIKATAVNHNAGRTPTISGQKPESQVEVMRQALESSGISPESLSYIEAGGAATIMGDPVEIKSISHVFSKYTDRKQFCAIGSVKANIGHLNHTSGLASIIKVILSLQHKKIPPLVHFKEPNPYIDFKNSPLYIDTALKDWQVEKDQTRRAAVSSFSVSGANCHVIVEEAPSRERQSVSVPHRFNIVTLSAKSRKALEKICTGLKETLLKNPDYLLDDICFTMNVGRGHYDHRMALICKSKKVLVKGLSEFDYSADREQGLNSRPVFLFPGANREEVEQLARDFYRKDFIACKYMGECSELFSFDKYPGVLFFAFLYALAKLWMDIGIEPAFVLGFGIGKYVSKVISGNMELAEALQICTREGTAEISFNKDKFRGNIELLFSTGHTFFLEIGPGNQLGKMTEEVLEGKSGWHVFHSYGAGDGEKTLLEVIAELYVQGITIDFSSLRRIQLVNLWGTSETTLAKTCYFIRESDVKRERVPVGKPIRGAAVMVLDENMELCDQLVKGELYIQTPFRTFGYYDSPRLNKKRFIRSPFSDSPGDLLHRTGDLGSILADGNIDLLGRNDRQVNIRGMRVELEEIESVLIKHPAVKEAAVIKKDLANKNELLCGYISIAEESLVIDIKEYVSDRLPNHMVPGRFIPMEKIPRTPNCKIDYKALPDPLTEAKTGIPISTPQDRVEEKLLELWTGLLGIGPNTIDINSNFFELGGNSLNIMALISRIHNAH